MPHRPLHWLLCLLFGIALALPQAAVSAWVYEGEECMGSHAAMMDSTERAQHDDGLTESSMETMTCWAPCSVCNGSPQAFDAGPAPSHEPRWVVAESFPLRVPDRLERPPRA
ncbi:hypothetical protein [Halomonas kalidii]|uniref:DUF2946 domain-containing protein n=1 Tax=Halomonas kalidii TaxID=3043293 RepID=A0ABT6VIL4_9GAMM|nr:hypothetical protein [Halomonas kalidii]MDI5933821.1 hypothetical protein [Halomonas kalidii]